MIWFLSALLLALASCKVVTPAEFRRAEIACKAHGGLEYAEFGVFMEDAAEVKCMNGARLKLRKP